MGEGDVSRDVREKAAQVIEEWENAKRAHEFGICVSFDSAIGWATQYANVHFKKPRIRKRGGRWRVYAPTGFIPEK